ncbi:MAG: helix-turn-helix domain-containing protein [Kineosporiaceae bacterium]|nr:helix-turn-helix domain-containing protein [Kineosporiaceae bacterium]
MATGASSTVLRWDLARRLRELRLSAELTIEDVAKELMCSPAKVSRMETAGRGIQPRDVRDLCRFYKVTDEVREELMAMARDARRPGWWHDYRTLDEQTKTFIGLETSASAILMLESRAVPGLMQTRDYTETLLRGLLPPEEQAGVEEMVELRQKRIERVRSGEVSLEVLADETVFRRDFGRPDILRRQIQQLIDFSTYDNVQLRILPFSAPASPGIHGSFQHLALASNPPSEFVFIEGLRGHFLIDRETDVARFLRAYESTKIHTLPPEETHDWLRSLLTGSA